MSKDLDTLLTALYVLINDHVVPPRTGRGRRPGLTDSELLCWATTANAAGSGISTAPRTGATCFPADRDSPAILYQFEQPFTVDSTKYTTRFVGTAIDLTTRVARMAIAGLGPVQDGQCGHRATRPQQHGRHFRQAHGCPVSGSEREEGEELSILGFVVDGDLASMAHLHLVEL